MVETYFVGEVSVNERAVRLANNGDVRLFHGTSLNNALQILEEGMVVSKEKNWKESEDVFFFSLLKHQALYWGLICQHPPSCFRGKKIVLIEVLAPTLRELGFTFKSDSWGNRKDDVKPWIQYDEPWIKAEGKTHIPIEAIHSMVVYQKKRILGWSFKDYRMSSILI
ncbi:MAG: hypothetical protein ACTSPB_00505 [Candidatus Thorarchaeota archaeon]